MATVVLDMEGDVSLWCFGQLRQTVGGSGIGEVLTAGLIWVDEFLSGFRSGCGC